MWLPLTPMDLTHIHVCNASLGGSSGGDQVFVQIALAKSLLWRGLALVAHVCTLRQMLQNIATLQRTHQCLPVDIVAHLHLLDIRLRARWRNGLPRKAANATALWRQVAH
jgi:hypothetical protein